MSRIVLDTNVVVSGLLSLDGPPSDIIDLLLDNRLRLVVNDVILAEYRRVLTRPELKLDQTKVDALLEFAARAERVSAEPLPISLPDESDRPFLEVAIAGGVDALVTGNTRHFRIAGGRLALAIVTPRQFIDAFAGR